MTVLKKYQRIEASGLWRPDAESQRRDVVASLGDATITIRSANDQPLAHWSIAATVRANPGKMPARYHPDGDSGEELELPGEEAEMVAAIDAVHKAIDRARPKPGRLRWFGILLSGAAIAYAALIWLPAALTRHTLSVVPTAARAEIGAELLDRIQRVTGPACGTSASSSSLARLGRRLDTPRLAVMRGGIDGALHLPGGHILLARALVEDFEEPDVAAGFALAEKSVAAAQDPLRSVLDHAGTYATFRLLTTGRMEGSALDAYAEHALTATRGAPDVDALLVAFESVEIRSTPYAYARDVTGEKTLPLIEADPISPDQARPVLSDPDWLRLQAICER